LNEFDDRDPVARRVHALEESAIERLAADERPLRSGPKHRTRAEIERPQLSESEANADRAARPTVTGVAIHEMSG
jgi:hypothetical protein